MELKQILLESFQAASILLVFVTLLFTLRYSSIVEDLDKDIPVGDLDKKDEKRRLKTNFIIQSLPIIILSGTMFYLFLPTAIHIFKISKLNLWNFNFLYTSYIFIVIWMGVLFLWSAILGFLILLKISSI